MKVTIKRFDTSLPLPAYKSAGAAGVDLYSRLDVAIPARSIGRIPLNIAVELPVGYWGKLAARSSTHKLGLIPANGIGVFDYDYRGNNDEWIFLAYNFTEEEVKVERGMRIAQLLIMKHEAIEFSEVESLESADRGGFGSTGL